MTDQHYYVKNMVCPRCIMAVEKIICDLNLQNVQVKLGQIISADELNKEVKTKLAGLLELQGFEFLEPGKSALISRIKSSLIEIIHQQDEPVKINFSTWLSDKFLHDYSYLSRLFSTVEGITLEKYILQLKTEKIKELLIYEDLSLKEIAYRLNYSSAAHLSSQFKKITGMSPGSFRQMQNPRRKSLDSL